MGTPKSLLDIAIVGATGKVGQEFLKILDERKFPINNFKVFGSEASKGNAISFRGKSVQVETLSDGCFDGMDLVLFATDDKVSREWAPKAVASGAFAIDNSSVFRMNPEVPLIVPEVNENEIPSSQKPNILANPNCSTIQLVVALNPLKLKFGIDSVKVATYQSVSGAGKAALEELKNQTMAHLHHKPMVTKVFPHQIAFNNLPHIGSFDDDGFTTEENKLMSETRKILDYEELSISAFAVRTPTVNAHSEAVWVTLSKNITRKEFIETMVSAPGVVVEDDILSHHYPLNAKVSGKDGVYVGRIHKDPNDSKTWMMWVVADNIRKGAALNAIQIAERVFDVNRAN